MEKDSSTKPVPPIGVWKLVSFEARREGEEPSFPFGKDAKGLLIYTDVGRFSVQMMRANRAKFVSGDQWKGTVEEVNHCFTGCISYFGGTNSMQMADSLFIILKILYFQIGKEPKSAFSNSPVARWV